MKGQLIFNNLVEISSYPCEVFVLIDLIAFSMSLVYVGLCFIFGYGVLKFLT
jgi:hypothetical protein